MSDQEERVFKNKLEAAKYLRSQGYKVGKSKVYNDAQEGRLRIRESGRVYMSDLEAYIKAEGLKRPDIDGGLENQQERLRKEELERRELELKVEKREFELAKEQGQYIPREDFELELASRAGVLDNGLRSAIKQNARDWVYMVGGQADRVPDLVEEMLSVLDRQLNEFARMDRFEVIFVDGQEDETREE